jgi:hypothetical protein
MLTSEVLALSLKTAATAANKPRRRGNHTFCLLSLADNSLSASEEMIMLPMQTVPLLPPTTAVSRLDQGIVAEPPATSDALTTRKNSCQTFHALLDAQFP